MKPKVSSSKEITKISTKLMKQQTNKSQKKSMKPKLLYWNYQYMINLWLDYPE